MGWRVARLALHARHELVIGPRWWFPSTGTSPRCVKGPPTPPTRSGSFRLLRGMCFLQCVSRRLMSSPAPLFLPVFQLIGHLPANPTGANCPLWKLGQGPPFPHLHTCRTHGHEEILVLWSVGGKENRRWQYTRRIKYQLASGGSPTGDMCVKIKVACGCVPKFGSPPCCAINEQILAGLAARNCIQNLAREQTSS